MAPLEIIGIYINVVLGVMFVGCGCTFTILDLCEGFRLNAVIIMTMLFLPSLALDLVILSVVYFWMVHLHVLEWQRLDGLHNNIMVTSIGR